MERNEYIEFAIEDESKFKDLERIIEELWKTKKHEDYKSDAYWLEQFPNYALKTFRFRARDLKPDFIDAGISQPEGKWHFYSLVGHLVEDVDVKFLGCEDLGNGVGRFNYDANGYPYGGIGGMTMFVNAFGCKATKIDDGGGIYKVNWIDEFNFKLEDITYSNDTKPIIQKESLWNRFMTLLGI